MPLASGKESLKSELHGIFSDIGGEKDARTMAKRISKAIHNAVLTASPMTIITTLPGSVAAATTTSSIQGQGLGGLDRPAPGMTLSGALPLFISELTLVFNHGGSEKSALEFASQISQAFYNYFSQAMVMTQDKTDSALPAPPPVGPVSSTIKGKGGIDQPQPGQGYDSALGEFEENLFEIFSDVAGEKSAPQFAERLGNAIHRFCKEGKVETQGSFVAVAAVDPTTLTGAYLPGAGASTTSRLE